MKAKRIYLMALIAVVVAIIIGVIAIYSGNSKKVLEGTLVYQESDIKHRM